MHYFGLGWLVSPHRDASQIVDMQVERFQYTVSSGWSVSEFPALDSHQTLVLVFFAPELVNNREIFDDLRRAYPLSHIVGCSTSGEIDNGRLTDFSASIAVIRFRRTKVSTAFVPIATPAHSWSCGEFLASELAMPTLRSLFVFSDGLNVNGSSLVQGMCGLLPEGVVVSGGLAGDGDRFEKTWVLKDGYSFEGGICAVGLYGQTLHVGHASQGGWDIFGIERQITRSQDNVLYELDGKPALALYKEYLGDLAKNLPASGLLFPLSLRSGNGYREGLVRTILAINEDDQSLTFAGDVPEGAYAQLMRANVERLIDSGGNTSLNALNGLPDQPVLSLTISCVGRRLVLGDRAEEEVEAAYYELPIGSCQIGFYSFGEIATNLAGGKTVLQNQTFTTTLLWEDAA